MKKGSAVALPSGTRYGAHVAPQRCTILRNGKAVISYHIRGVFYPLKFKIVLDMGYTSKPCQAPVFEGIWANFWGKIQLGYRSFLKGSSGQNQDIFS